MAISEDTGNQPAVLTWTNAWTSAKTTAAFSPQAATLLVALVSADGSSSATAGSVTDNTGTGAWTLLKRQAAATAFGVAEVWIKYFASAPGSMTVSVVATAGSANGGQLVVRSLLGAKSTQTGNVVSSVQRDTAGAMQASITASAATSWIYGSAYNWTNSTAMTAASGTTAINQFSDTTNGDVWAAFKTTSAATGSAQTVGFTTSVMGALAMAEILAASGTSYTPSQSDSIGITDDVTPVQGNVRSQSDPVGITDAVSIAASTVRQQDDAVGLTDTVTSAAANARTQNDSLGITDSISVISAINYVRTIDDAIGITDDASAGGTVYDAATDPSGTAYNAGPYSDSSQAINLGLKVTTSTDIPITGIRYWRQGSGNDGSSITVSLYQVGGGGTPLAQASATQPAGGVDRWITVLFSSSYTMLASGGEYRAAVHFPSPGFYIAGDTQNGRTGQGNQGPLSISNTGDVNTYDYGATAEPASSFSFFGGVDVVAQGSAGGTNYSTSLTDAIGLTDSASAVLDAVRIISDPVGITDAVSAVVGAVTTITDPIGITDTASATQALARTQSDAVGITDSAVAVQGLARTVSDAVGITDSATAVLSGHNYSVTIDDSIGITDTSVQQAIDYNYLLDPEPIGITDNVVGALGVARTVTDAIGITDTAAAAQALARTVTDPIGITDTAAASQALARTISDPIGITDSVTAVVVPAGAVVINDPETITDNVTTTQANTRQQDDALGISDTVTASMGFTRVLADAVGLTDSVTATVAMLRALADSIGITDTVSAVITPGAPINYVAVINDSIGITDDVAAHLPQREIVVAVTTGPSPWAVTTGGPRWAVTTEERV